MGAGKLAGMVLMALAALFAWRWLRGRGGTNDQGGPVMRRGEDAPASRTARRGDEDIITLEQDPQTGVFRPRDSRESDNSKG